MLFKSWCGIHHRVTDLQAYIDEYTYRFNRHFMNASIFDNLILHMIEAKLYYLDDKFNKKTKKMTINFFAKTKIPILK